MTIQEKLYHIQQLKYNIAAKKLDILEHRKSPILGFDIHHAYSLIINWYEEIIMLEQDTFKKGLYS